jgi:hypothetical protein
MAVGGSRFGPSAMAALGRRRVRAAVAIPVIALCGGLGAGAGVLFPVHPGVGTHEADALQRSDGAPHHALVPDAVLARAAPVRAASEGGSPSSRDYPAALPPEATSGAIDTLSGAVAVRKHVVPDAPVEAAASRAEKRQEARHEAYSRRARARRARVAAPSDNGSFLQMLLQ